MQEGLFFTEKDNFLEIIKQHLPNVKEDSVTFIKTGWTNFVMCASDGIQEYFFRFPRNRFFARMLLKDNAFCSFMKDKVSFEFPDLKLFYDKGRPFSMHKKIKGWSLTERFKHLSRQAVTNLAYDVAKFINELNQVDPKALPASCNMYLSKFLDQLSEVDTNSYDLSQHDFLRQCEQTPHVVHGDLNPGNILLDENDRMVGVIDFAFAGVSNNYVDLSRVIGRTHPSFAEPMKEAYEAVMKEKVDMQRVENMIHMWNYVEEQYILYIKENHPEIQLPS